MHLQAKILSLIKRTLAKDRTLSPYWKSDLSPTIKKFKGLHTDNVLENVFFPNAKRYKLRVSCILGL